MARRPIFAGHPERSRSSGGVKDLVCWEIPPSGKAAPVGMTPGEGFSAQRIGNDGPGLSRSDSEFSILLFELPHGYDDEAFRSRQ